MYYNPMKRFIFICLFSVMGFAFAQTAESQTHFKNGLSLGAFWAFNQDKSGGDFEVGLPIIRGEETGFMLRNHFLFSGYGGDGFGQVSVIGRNLSPRPAAKIIAFIRTFLLRTFL